MSYPDSSASAFLAVEVLAFMALWAGMILFAFLSVAGWST